MIFKKIFKYLFCFILFPSVAWSSQSVNVDGRTLFYKGEIGTGTSVTVQISNDSRSYRATFFSGKFRYQCEPSKISADGIFEFTSCGEIDRNDKNGQVDTTSRYNSEDIPIVLEGNLDQVVITDAADGTLNGNFLIKIKFDRDFARETSVKQQNANFHPLKNNAIKILHYKGERGSNVSATVRINTIKKRYQATFVRNKIKYECEPSSVSVDGIYEFTNCGDVLLSNGNTYPIIFEGDPDQALISDDRGGTLSGNYVYKRELTRDLAREAADRPKTNAKFDRTRLLAELEKLKNQLKIQRARKKTKSNTKPQTREKNYTKPGNPSAPIATAGSGFFVSKLGHVVTNEHVVRNCKELKVGDRPNQLVTATVIETDRRNDLALLKLRTTEMARAGTQSLIRKLGVAIVPLSSRGLLREKEIQLGEEILVAGYPFGELFGNTIKLTKGIVSSRRGIENNTGQFQMDAAAQLGNSGGPIYDTSGNIVGVVIAQLNKLKVAKAIGALPENVNFGIKASTVRSFLVSAGLPTRWSGKSQELPTTKLAKIAENQTLIVQCQRQN
tara:strand:+ start:1181 stop:2851 length:1671 start_codon:yes stop_codon:yes gene_type:complete